MPEKIKIKNLPIILKIIIPFLFTLSIFSLAINFNLINIEEITFFRSGNDKIIIDNSITQNSTTDVVIKNFIDSTAYVDYSKEVQVYSGMFDKTIGTRNNDKITYYNFLYKDKFGNSAFFKSYSSGESIWYADCNEDETNCAVHSKYRVENNKDEPICFIGHYEIGIDYGGYYIAPLEKTDYYYQNPLMCFEYSTL